MITMLGAPKPTKPSIAPPGVDENNTPVRTPTRQNKRKRRALSPAVQNSLSQTTEEAVGVLVDGKIMAFPCQCPASGCMLWLRNEQAFRVHLRNSKRGISATRRRHSDLWMKLHPEFSKPGRKTTGTPRRRKRPRTITRTVAVEDDAWEKGLRRIGASFPRLVFDDDGGDHFVAGLEEEEELDGLLRLADVGMLDDGDALDDFEFLGLTP